MPQQEQAILLLTPMPAAPDLRSLSMQDYHRMVEAGILAADERVELIEG
jgi:hypothetical protein